MIDMSTAPVQPSPYVLGTTVNQWRVADLPNGQKYPVWVYWLNESERQLIVSMEQTGRWFLSGGRGRGTQCLINKGQSWRHLMTWALVVVID
ncbi:Kelch repeat-containing protein [Fusarium oxysporum f. sp. albedinis]|nr:Kelch repeat-containing protein [Fusarium oxysporum f. sp. albedinis]